MKLEEHMAGEGGPKIQPGGDLPGEEVFVFPATSAQKRFWLLDQFTPGNPALNMPLAVRLQGLIYPEVLDQVINRILQRHEILRTNFRMMDDEVVQVIHPQKTIILGRQDITCEPESERDGHAADLMLQEAGRGFDLATGPLFRATLLKVRENEHLLMLTIPHIVCDGWSNGILIRELAQLYALILNAGPPLPELPVQYADFAQWQNEWLRSPAAEKQMQFWKSLLQGAIPVLDLPTDRPRQSDLAQKGTIQTRLLPKSLTDTLTALCVREDVTPFMLFIAGYAIILYGYSGEDDLVIGSPAANRQQAELEGLIGLFANPLMMRLDLSGNPTVRELMGRVKERSVLAFAHQAFPFEELLEMMQKERSYSGTPWLQAYFIFQKAFMTPQQIPNATMTPLRSVSPGAMFEWCLGVVERSEGIRLQLEYNPDLYDASTIDRMLERFEQVLRASAANLEGRIDQLAIVSDLRQEQAGRRRAKTGTPTSGNGWNARKCPPVPPASPAQAALLSVWEDILGRHGLGIRDNFFEEGGSSLSAMRLISEIKRRSSIRVPVRTFFQNPTVEALEKALSVEKPVAPKAELIQLKTGRARLDLVFLIDEGSLGLFKLAHFMKCENPLFASVSPLPESALKAALQNHASGLPSMEALAAGHVALIRSRPAGGALVLAGHCFGGILAFEVARQLQELGLEVEGVLLLDTWMARTTWRWRKQSWLRHHVGSLLRKGPAYLWRRGKRRLNLEKQALATKLKLAADGDFSLHVPWPIIMRIYQRAMARYEPKVLEGRGVLFVSREDWQSDAYRRLDNSLGADPLFTAGVQVLSVPGDHVTVLEEENLPELALRFEQGLELLSSKTGPSPKGNLCSAP